MPVGVTLNPIFLQVNYHGPYILTRLLEPVLIASKPSRVVNVASVEHRIGYIKDIRKFMFDAKKFLYSETKLGNVLLTYEHQRRLGSYGVQVCLLSKNVMTSAHLQWPTGLSTSTAFVVYQYCLLNKVVCHWTQICGSLMRQQSTPSKPLRILIPVSLTMRITVDRLLLLCKQDRLLEPTYIMTASA